MSAVKTNYEHISFNTSGVPIIEGTTMKVIELVLEQQAYGWSPEELLFQHPYLTLGKIYSALAYYWDHRDSLDQDIEQRLQQVNSLKLRFSSSPMRSKLKAQGLI
jgi:uncharacterized protein (DUF433 family)